MKNLDTTNEQYDRFYPLWTKCRDAIEGQEAVHAAGERYLPRLSGQSASEYLAYKQRATYFNASGRTLDGMTGLIFRKSPQVIAPASMQNILDDIDLCGSDLTSFSEMVVDELCKVSRVGILVDYPSVQTVGLTRGMTEAMGLRPYASIYSAENILDWRYERIGSVQTLTMVKLLEYEEVQTGELEYAKVKQIRLLELIEGRYRVRIYQQGETEWVQVGDDVFPLMNNAPIREIPFIFASINGLDSDIKKPVLLDLVNVNLSHYRSMADYEHGLHFTGLPTPFVWGAVLEAGTSINIGSSEAFVAPNPDGHAEYLEFQGQGLTVLRDAIRDKQDMMALLGSKILAAEKKAVEAAETAEIHRAGENSILASIANAASQALTKMLMWMGEWTRANGEISVMLNTDYMPAQMSPQLFQQLTMAYMQGTISYSTYFYNLKAGEIIRNDVSEEEERELLEVQDVNLNDGNG